MTDTTKDLLARLVGFTPGPHQVSGVRAKQAPKLSEHARFLTIGPDDDAVALVFFDMKTGRGHMDAKLYAAAPDLHRELSASLAREAAQQAEIAHLSDHIEGVAKSTHALLCGYEKRVADQQAEIERLRAALRLEVKRSRRHLAASTLAIVEEMEAKP
jgi:hypothetical protein